MGIILFILTCFFGLYAVTSAQTEVSVHYIDGLHGSGPWYNDTILVGTPITYEIWFENSTPSHIIGFLYGQRHGPERC